MAASKTSLAEKLLVLLEVGEDCLTRMYHVKVEVTRDARPVFFTDKTYARVVDSMVRKFPENDPGLDRIQGAETVRANARDFHEQLQPHYLVFKDQLEWKEATIDVLSEASTKVNQMSMSVNPFMTRFYLDLMVKYIRVHILMRSVVDRKALLSMFSLCHKIKNNENEPTYNRVSLYVAEFDNPFKRIQGEFSSFSAKIGATLFTLKSSMEKMFNLQVMRKDALLSLTVKPDQLTHPAQESFQFEAMLASRYYAWVLLGFLFMPEQFTRMEALPMVESMLGEAFLLQLHRDESQPIHADYDELFGSYKGAKHKEMKLKRKRKQITAALNSAVTAGAVEHRHRRTYCRQSLADLLKVFEDFPGLVGPKFQVALTALSLAQDEIFYYFRHRSHPPPKSAKGYQAAQYVDANIFELIELHYRMREFVLRNRKIVQVYNLEYLAGQDLRRLRELLDKQNSTKVPGVDSAARMEAMLAQLQDIDVTGFMEGRVGYSFAGFRMNWYRVEASMSESPECPATELCQRFHIAVRHSECVDHVEELLAEHTSLADTWFQHELLLDEWRAVCLDSTAVSGPAHAGAIFWLLAEWPLSATGHRPHDKPEVGKRCTQIAEQLLNQLSQRCTTLLSQIVAQKLEFDHQLDSANAATQLLIGAGARTDRQAPPVTPAAESHFKPNSQVTELRLLRRTVDSLVRVLQRSVEFVVHDHAFVPREYLREALYNFTCQFIGGSVIAAQDKAGFLITRPSVLQRRIGLFSAVLVQLESYVDMNVSDLLREAMLQLVYTPTAADPAAKPFDYLLPANKVQFQEGCMLRPIVDFYVDFFVTKLPTQQQVVWAPKQQAFISRHPTSLPYYAEDYCHLTELTSLVRVIGPYGARVLSRELMVRVWAEVGKMKTFLVTNEPHLKRITAEFSQPSADQAPKLIKDLDLFAQQLTSVGAMLHFHDLLQRAAAAVTEEATPFITGTLKAARFQYGNNLLLVPELLAVDQLAVDSGIDLFDTPLAFLAKQNVNSADAPLWNLLPAAFTACFYSRVWGDALYLKQYEAHTNNVHCSARAMSAIMIAVKRALCTTPEGEVEVVSMLEKFVEISAITLLRFCSLNPSDLSRSVKLHSLPSVVIFLDQFVTACPLLKRDALETYMPYALMRSMYRDLLSKPSPKGW
jgi:NCK-associated protein 1